MSTRSHIGFYDSAQQRLEYFDALLYRHCDGYPSGMLPDLLPFLKDFAKRRGWDREYVAARCLAHLCQTNGPDDVLGYGICSNIHTDIEYFYAVSAGFKVRVYQARWKVPPSQWKLIAEFDATACDVASAIAACECATV